MSVTTHELFFHIDSIDFHILRNPLLDEVCMLTWPGQDALKQHG